MKIESFETQSLFFMPMLFMDFLFWAQLAPTHVFWLNDRSLNTKRLIYAVISTVFVIESLSLFQKLISLFFLFFFGFVFSSLAYNATVSCNPTVSAGLQYM